MKSPSSHWSLASKNSNIFVAFAYAISKAFSAIDIEKMKDTFVKYRPNFNVWSEI